MRKLLLVCALLLSIGCGHKGPDLTLCTVSTKLDGFQCASKDTEFFMSFEDGADLRCFNRAIAEQFVKACKKGILIPVISCQLNMSVNDRQFICSYPEPGIPAFSVPVAKADNWLCFSEKDLGRLKERCHK